MIKKILIILIFALVIICGLGYWAIKHDYLLLYNSNSITVTADSPLTPDKVKIEFGISVNSINRTSDADLFSNRQKYDLLYDGKVINEIKNEYGENDFLVTYDNKYYCSFRQFKTNWRHQHDYKFHFYTRDTAVFIRADIAGVDDMQFDSPMRTISTVDKN